MLRQTLLRLGRSTALPRARAEGRSVAVLARPFSTEGKAADVPLPINLYGLPARYANALFKTAYRAGALADVDAELKSFGELMTTNEALKSYLKNPVISRKDKAEDMGKICKGMSELTRGFFGVLAENGRLQEVPKIIDTFDQLMKAQRGEVEATVITAAPLTKKELTSVRNTITENYLEEGKTLMLNQKVDEAILGGLQLQVGDRFLDLSIQSKIKRLHERLAES